MSRGTMRKSRPHSHQKSHPRRRPLRVESLEPRLALSGNAVVELSTTPDAPTWLVAPYASGDTSSYSVSMAVQPVEGLEYYFHNVTITGHDSGWQSDVTYVDQGLSANTAYTYEVKARNEDPTEGDYSTQASATTFTAEVAAVMRLANEIRAIETFSNPNNPGQIYQALIKDNFPDPDAANNTACEQSGTNGVAAYPGDMRNTPSAFQVDLANMGVYDNTNPAKEQFGIWHQAMAMPKNSGLYDTQFAFSKSTLKDFFGIEVNSAGLIQEIDAAAASVFLHDDALAYSTTWSSTDNALIGLHIDAFRSEQLSLYLAGRDSAGARVGVTDPRTSPPGVMHLAESLQYQAAKSYMYAVIQKYKTHAAYKPTYDNLQTLFGAEFDIKSSQNAFGVNKGDHFKCRLNDLFLIGGAYVSGEAEVFGLMQAIWAAYENGSTSWAATGGSIGITRTSPAGQLTGATFTFDGTPMNVDENYPSVLHYAAVVSALPSVDFDDKASWGIVDDGSRCIENDDQLDYERLSPTAITTISQSQDLTTGGLYAYKDFASGQTLTLKGADAFMVLPTTVCTITADGYSATDYPMNCYQKVPEGRLVDISDFVNDRYLGDSAEDIFNCSFYSWWGAEGQQMARVNDSSVPTGTELTFYFVPASKDKGPQDVLDNLGKFWDSTSPYHHSARISVANVDVLGRASTAEQWAENFITTASGKGVIDASQTTGDVFIVADNSIQKVLLGSGKTTVIVAGAKTSQKTYVLNANATTSPTLDIRSGDVIDWSELTQGLTWEGGAATTYDNNTTSPPYLRYSYYTSWTGTQGSETKGAFQAIVHANGNTKDTDDPVKIVQYALNPTGVTIDRATAQTAQTSASLMNYTVVFSEEVTDFNGTDVTLSGPAATIDGASIVVTNPSGDKITYSVAVTLKDTAATGNVVGTIGAGKVHNAEGFANLASTSTYNTVAYAPNTITGQEISNAGLTLATASNGEPLPGVHVSLTRSTPGFTERTTLTDSNGYYLFENVPDGTYQVTATPPNACLSSGSNTTTVNAEDSQTYEADFSVGALKPGYIPNRMMVTSSLPVGSIQWQQVVQEALELGEQTGSQSTQLNVAATVRPAAEQYLTFAPRAVSLASGVPIADGANPAPEKAAYTKADDTPAQITQAAVAPIVQEAITRWAAAGLEPTALNKMQNTTFVLGDLAGLSLGMTKDATVWLDSNAAGRGWFVDLTPDDDEEFGFTVADGPLRAVDPQVLDSIDLFTVVAHELGHVAGLQDSDLGNLMGPVLQTGLRIAPNAHDVALASV